MQQFLRMMAIFIQYPWLAAVVGVLMLALGRSRGRGVAMATGIIWLLYAVYETGMKQRWLCTGECNIRVDLLLVYPILLVLTVVSVVSLLRTKRDRR
jgi:hypothetical protein